MAKIQLNLGDPRSVNLAEYMHAQAKTALGVKQGDIMSADHLEIALVATILLFQTYADGRGVTDASRLMENVAVELRKAREGNNGAT